YIRHSRFTHEFHEKSKEFSVSIPLERTSEIIKAISFCGSKSGKDVDKFKECNLTALNGIDVQSPAIKEIPLTLECKVIYKQEQEHNNIPQDLKEKFYPQNIKSSAPMENKNFHTVYYGEIVNAYIAK
ncbi:flavin reductase, partial [bacterium]|nr:flavin reductase [bacterium]